MDGAQQRPLHALLRQRLRLQIVHAVEPRERQAWIGVAQGTLHLRGQALHRPGRAHNPAWLKPDVDDGQ